MPLKYYQRKLSKDDINALPIKSYEGRIELITGIKSLDRALKHLKQERVLGFDTETKPSFRKGMINNPSLVQFATVDTVYLIQLICVPFGQAVAELLSDHNVLKVGVSIADDMRELRKLYEFEPAGVLDLGNIAKMHHFSTQGLRNLAANLFDFRISKGPQCSNWSAKVLSKKQIIYAATDAWIGREIFLRMEELEMI